MKNILVSIIIPINQLHNYFKRCLDSIFNQTLKNFEIIVVDDYSKDDIKSAIGNYLADSRCRYIRTEASSGPGGARNAGITPILLDRKGRYDNPGCRRVTNLRDALRSV